MPVVYLILLSLVWLIKFDDVYLYLTLAIACYLI